MSNTTANFYNHILQGSDATKEHAICTALGLDWQEVEVKNESFPFLTYYDTINEIDIYYNYGCDSFYFAKS
jgi:hypothetical protein